MGTGHTRRRCTRGSLRLGPAVTALALAACTGDRGFTVTTADGVEIVESHRPVWGETAEWSIDETPKLRIPAWSEPHGRDSVHVADATRLADGTVIAANGHTSEIGWFDDEGRSVRRVGGFGTNAGEFQSLSQVIAIRDSLWAFDGMGRWNVFDLDGDLLATMYLEPHGGGWSTVEPLTRSNLLLVPDINSRLGFPPAAGRSRPAMPILRYTRAGAAIDTLAVLPGHEVARLELGETNVQMREPFGHPTVLHGGAERFYVGTAERMEIEVYDDAGFLERILRIPDLDLRLSDVEWAGYVEETAASLDGDSIPGAADVLRALPKPAGRPAYSRFLEDAPGTLWVAEHASALGPEPGPHRPATTWFVFDPQGRWLGRIETPSGLHVVEIGADYILGIQRTAEGTEVRVHDLSR